MAPDDPIASENPAGMPAMSAAELTQAFAAFSRASDELSSAYNALQGQVSLLTERLSVLMGALPAGVLVLDRDNRILEANRAAAQLFGEGLGGTSWGALEGRLAATETPGEWQLEAAGLARRIAVNRTALDSGDGHIVLLHDITDTHRMRLATERNERLPAMGEMVAGLAHQLRTPLSAALLYVANLGSMELGPAERTRVAERSMERLRHLERLIRDMLLFARGDSLGRQHFKVCELTAELAHVLEPVARARQVRFTEDCECDDATLFGDRKALAGALTNLLENAVQATPTGGSVSLGAALEGAEVSFRVSDTGCGMDAALQERIFQPFFTTRAEGTGLGLAIARGVARGHGGDIAIVSTPGRGTTFTLRLPLAAEIADQMEQQT